LRTFVYRGSSQQRESAVEHKFDMVWLYRSPIPCSGGRGVFHSIKRFLPAFATLRVEEGGGGVSALMFKPGILRHSEILGATGEAALSKVHKKKSRPKCL
jgi:hypothetical protein